MHPEAFKKYLKYKEAGEPVPAEVQSKLLDVNDVTKMAVITVAILFIAAFFWGTEAISIGATDILVAVLLYAFFIMPPNMIAMSYMSDSVFFIFGILAIAVGVAQTGLDKRIGLILLSRIKSAKMFCLVFFPFLSLCAGFLSEHALVALLVPVLMGVYKASCKANGVEKDHALAIMMLLGMTFAANVGGLGSPAAGGRNAIMVGYLNTAGMPISFLEWMVRGLPIVPVLSVSIGIYMYLRLKPRFKVKDINPSEVVKAEVAKLPKFGGKELIMTIILVIMIFTWIYLGEEFGLGGPTIMAVFAMFLFRIISWENIQKDVAFDIVGLYAAASAMGAGLKFTGGALWLANAFVGLMPDALLASSVGLPIAVSLLTGTLTNFMSDGATVAALGPIVLPMGTLADVSLWKVGLATAFASSFAHCLIVGTPNNAIVYGMGRDPETGEKLLSIYDFVKYGVPVWIISMLVMWGWGFLFWWNFVSWPV
jgi:solute carrier family 13 (sodium-dependent dicarboxylate transporter), member 2/3/5